MKVTLTVIEGPHRGASFSFGEPDAFLVGRSPEAQFRLPLQDKTLSRTHFLIEVNPPQCRIMDMASTNGVFVNGKPVHAADLQDGDRITAGSTTLAFAVEDRDGTTEYDGSLSTRVGLSPVDEAPPDFPGYRIGRTLGEGGMGVVMLAHRIGDDTPVAIKAIRPTVTAGDANLARFLREASLLRRLEHPGIVRFHDIGWAGGRLFFAMQYVDGPNLAEILSDRGPLPVPAAVGIACQMLRALGHAHERGSIHRDIKPANVLTSTAGGRTRALLADFGLAKLYHESSLSGLSFTGQVGGTFAYMPPEQITHFRDARPPADLYATAATLYTLLTNQTTLDFRGRPDQQIARILFEEPTPIRDHRPEIPEPLARAIHKALAKKAEDRFPDAGSMCDALAPFARRVAARRDP